MEQTGFVTEITGNKIRVRVDRESACGGNCVSCKGCPSSAVIIECDALDGINVGDAVILTLPDKSFLKNAFWGYGLMTVLAIAGAVLGYAAGKSEGGSVLGAAIGIGLGMAAVKLIFKNKDVSVTAKRKS